MLLQVEHPTIDIDVEDDQWVASFCGLVKWRSGKLAMVFNIDDNFV